MFKKMPRKSLVVVDYDPEVIDHLHNKKVHFIYGDATDIELLDELNLAKSKLIVSTITHFPTNRLLIEYVEKINPSAVIITRADSAADAAELYGLGASYVMVPHFVGTEKLGTFIARHGLNRSDFSKYKEKHLAQLKTHYDLEIAQEQ